MKRRVVAIVAGLAALGLVALAWSGRPNLDRANALPAAAAESPAASIAEPHDSPRTAIPTRDLFEFGDDARSASASVAPTQPAADTQPATTPAPAPRARLVGFVRTATTVRAALSLDGRVEVVALGEERAGFRVDRKSVV